MTKLSLVLGAAAVALSTAPAEARHHGHHYGRPTACAKWRHGHCVRWANRGYAMSTARHNRYRVGYVFGPSYSYTDVGALPQPYVTRYHLTPDYRYVYRDNNIYVVDPTTYAVTRILNAIPR